MRFPEPGRGKTRLAAGVGAASAFRIHTLLVRRTLGVVHDFKKAHPDVSVTLAFTPPERAREMALSFPGPWKAIPQTGSHLGERMGRAMRWAFDQGAEQVALLGSDIVDLQSRDIEAAFTGLGSGSGAVIGPARDGGFYLIGLRRYVGAPFRVEDWGTGEVCARTESLLRSSGLGVRRMEVRCDVDRAADLDLLEREPLYATSLSVIVPTLQEAATLLPRLQPLSKALWPDDELIIVQGTGSVGRGEDGLEHPSGVRVVTSPRGRGIQLSRGAAQARGSILLFLHADTVLPPQFPYLVRRACESPNMSLGCFRLGFAPSSRALDLIARWANARTIWLGMPYGDQALFCSRTVYDRVGGFQRRYLMEDVDFVKGCRKIGALRVLDETVGTSPDRYLRRGILRASLENHFIMLLHHLGLDEKRLYAFYYRR